jgi:hypothetical protein
VDHQAHRLLIFRLFDQFGNLGVGRNWLDQDNMLRVQIHLVWPVQFLSTHNKDALRFFGLGIDANFDVVHISQDGMVSGEPRELSIKDLVIIQKHRLILCSESEVSFVHPVGHTHRENDSRDDSRNNSDYKVSQFAASNELPDQLTAPEIFAVVAVSLLR